MAAVFVLGDFDAIDYNFSHTGGSQYGAIAMSTSGSYQDLTYSKQAFRFQGAGQVDKYFDGQTDFWVHYDTLASNISDCDNPGMQLYDRGADEVVLRVKYLNGTAYLEYWNGASFTTIVSPSANLGIFTTLKTIDIHCKLHETEGRFAAYVDGVLTAEFTGDTILYTPVNNVDRIKISGNSGTQTRYSNFSQVFGYPTSTVGMKMLTLAPNGAGFNTDFDGTYADVDQVDLDHLTFIQSDAADEISTFAVTDMITQDPDPDLNMGIEEVVVTGHIKRGTTGPQNFQFAARSNGANYFGDTEALGIGLEHFQYSWTVDPATSAKWQDDALDNLELGVKSIT
jgi:hypothetical protein